ncbi:Piwi-domain-containing protein [Lophiostoma macrostomum CBS 122681]|uniref:Piwi-domain-containing protein n=1 Tax=Lophiostoma macrostomum CBS 122681 TaxID=1314788 RepID=A0A6A6SU48_9PLEO|nr:Piwi-domain-containing protein [Lophiostoma macrostomum CBS 122681]
MLQEYLGELSVKILELCKAYIRDSDGNVPQPDAQVTTAEDASVQDLSAALARSSLEGQFPSRPGYGTMGRKIVLFTNYFRMEPAQKGLSFFRYSVAFQGKDEPPKPKKKRLIQLLLQTDPFVKIVSASDWAQVVITTQKVKLEGKRQKFDLEWFPADEEPLPAKDAVDSDRRAEARKRNTYALLVEEIGTVALDELLKDLSAATTTYPLKLETIQALNIVMSYDPSTDTAIAVGGQNKFYPIQGHPQFQSTSLGTGLDALRGYFSSVRTSIIRIIVNINVATGAFYKAGPLLAMLHEIGGAPRNPGDFHKMETFVRKLRFETNYIPQTDAQGKAKRDKKGAILTKRKVHTITGLSPFNANAKTVTFECTDASGKSKRISVEQYFSQTYQLRLETPQAPLVNYGTTKDPKWIPAELCAVLPGQLARRLLQGDQTRNMIAFAARRPFENAQSIVNDGLQVTKINPVSQGLNVHLKGWGIKIDPNMLTVHGRILQAPTLKYKSKTCDPNNGAWNLDVRQLGHKPFLIAKSLPSWSCLVINSGQYETIRGGQDGARALLEAFRKTLDTYGLNPGPVQQPAAIRIQPGDLHNRQISKIQSQITSALQQGFKEKPKFLFVILPNDNAVLYDCVKYVCDIKHGVPNICNIGSKVTKKEGQPQYFANVALKFNQKLGGVNHSIQADKLKPLDAQTIVFGIDVTHPSPGSSEKAPSIAGIVASVNPSFAQYPASIRTQTGRQEMVAELEEMILERLRLWQKRNGGRLPTKVIVYRDGVSEGQYRLVLEKEYPSFIGAFEKLYGDASKHPKISIIIVGKRHHTRFYPSHVNDTDGRTWNPKPGTVVDRGVTGEKLFDFFLLAHQGLQGTSKPAHYVVIKDDNKLGADQLQSLTHNLCYTFARATRSVSICPPAYYADILCERGRSYLQGVLKGDGAVEFGSAEWQRDVHPALAETMFYI